MLCFLCNDLSLFSNGLGWPKEKACDRTWVFIGGQECATPKGQVIQPCLYLLSNYRNYKCCSADTAKKCSSWPKVTNMPSLWWHQMHTCISYWIKALQYVFHTVWIALSTRHWLRHTPRMVPRASFTLINYLYKCTMFNCPVVQISALDIVFVCFIYTNELKYKVLKTTL